MGNRYRPWLTNATAATAILGSILGGLAGQVDPVTATQGAVAGAAVLGLGRKLEQIRQILELVGTLSAAVRVPSDAAVTERRRD